MHIFRSVFAFARRKILHGHGTHGTHSSILSIGSCWPITKIHTFCPCCVSGAFHINFKCSWKTEMRNLQKTEIAPSVPFTLFSKSSCEINALSQQFPMNCQSNCKSRDNSCSYFLLQYFQSEHEAFINIGSTYCCAWAGVVGMVPTMILLYSRFHMPEYQVISLLPLYIKLQYIYIYISLLSIHTFILLHWASLIILGCCILEGKSLWRKIFSPLSLVQFEYPQFLYRELGVCVGGEVRGQKGKSLFFLAQIESLFHHSYMGVGKAEKMTNFLFFLLSLLQQYIQGFADIQQRFLRCIRDCWRSVQCHQCLACFTEDNFKEIWGVR